MQAKELLDLIEDIISLSIETKNIEFKTGKNRTLENLYDTFSSFSNTSGGIIIFGIDEKNNYEICGISNPGGLYGRLSLDDLGKSHSDIRNPFIAAILEVLEITENRYSGIPTIYKEMEKAGLMPPKFENIRGTFKVTLYNTKRTDVVNDELISKIKIYCKTPRTKESISKYFGYDEKHPAYFMNSYIIPLIEQGILAYTIPNKPKSKNQKIYTVEEKK